MEELKEKEVFLSRIIRDAAAHKRVIKWGYVRQFGGLYPSECDSVAAHSNAVAVLAVILATEYKADIRELTEASLDIEAVSLMATFHDYGEGRSGDTGASSYATRGFCNLHSLEREGLLGSLDGLKFRDRAIELFDEYRAYSTPEAVLVHIADNLEGLEKALHAARGSREILTDVFRILGDNLAIYAQRHQLRPQLGWVTDFLVTKVLLPGARVIAAAYGVQHLLEEVIGSFYDVKNQVKNQSAAHSNEGVQRGAI